MLYMLITNTISRITKYKPNDSFNNNSQDLEDEVINNAINSQKNLNKNRYILKINSFNLISNYYIRNYNSLNIKFGKKEKTIPGIVVGRGNGSCNPVRIKKKIIGI